jgi:hypothetical protein
LSEFISATAQIAAVCVLTYCLGFVMKLATSHQPTGYIGRLQQSALGWKVSRQIARRGNKDVSALVAVAPLVKLLHTRLEHLIRLCQDNRIARKQDGG